VSLLLLGASMLYGTLSLGRLPTPYVDEPFFNYPAIRFLRGEGFNWTVGPRQPSAEHLWALHGTFYPWLQVATFSLLGISQFAARLPQWLAAHVAIALIALAVARRGYRLAPLALIVGWLGDTVYQEIRYGRPEGLCLLSIAIAFSGLLSWFETAKPRWVVVTAMGAGAAFGFNAGAGLLVIALAIPLLVHAGPKQRLRVIATYAGGLAIPGLIYLATVRGDPFSALAQLRYNVTAAERAYVGQSIVARMIGLLRLRRWAIPWTLVTWGLSLLPLAWLVKAIRSRVVAGMGRVEMGKDDTPLRLAIAWAGVGAYLVLVVGTKLPYYLVLSTPWPLIALLVWAERSLGDRLAKLALAFAMLIWLPSAAFNLMRAREPLIYGRMSLSRLSESTSHLPAGARVVGSPELFAYAEEAKMRFVPVPWYAEDYTPEESDWLLISVHDMEHTARSPDGTERVAKAAFASRSAPLRFDLFPSARQNEYPVLLYAPVGEPTPSLPMTE
jgi:hypothetical protein